MRIITHDGLFHADEVFAIALIFQFIGVCPVERRRKVSKEELQNPEVWVLDQYGELNSQLHNFDHHQDKTLDATCKIILTHLYLKGYIDLEIHKLLLKPINSISHIDVNGYAEMNGYQVNEFFKCLNNLENGFEVALAFARTFIQSIQLESKNIEKSLKIFEAGTVPYEGVRVCSEYPVFWKSYNKEKILVFPEKGEWRVLSQDIEEYPIVEIPEQLFIHVNKFVAGYPSKTAAVKAAMLTVTSKSLANS